MNLALPAFLLLLTILPGYVFLSAYEKSENTSIERKPFDVSSAIAIIVSTFIHLIGFFAYSSIFGKPDLTILFTILAGIKLTVQQLQHLSSHFHFLVFYLVLSYIFAFLFGKLVQSCVVALNPYKSSMLAFNTPWYYELKGKLSEQEDAQLIKLSCLTETKEGAYLYYGVLEDFYLNENGELDRIVLSDVSRRHISKDESQGPNGHDPRFYEIKGDRMLLKYSQLVNINIEYYYIYPDEP